MKFFLYMVRWQLSTLILYPCVNWLPFGNFYNVVIANLAGGALFWFFDKYVIFNKPKKEKKVIIFNEE